jgi:mRNA interferase YafQ
MRTVKYTNRFNRDYRREKSGQHGKKLDAILMHVVNLLAADKALPRQILITR